MIKPYLSLFFGITALSLSSLFVHWAEAPGIITSLYRMLFATLLLLPAFIISIKHKKISFEWKFVILPIIAGIFTGLDHSFWSTSIGYTNIANATLFNNIAPIWVALFGIIFLKEKLYKKYFIGLFLTLFGVIIIYGNNLLSGNSLSFGDGLGIDIKYFLCRIFYRHSKRSMSLQYIDISVYRAVHCNNIVDHDFTKKHTSIVWLFT